MKENYPFELMALPYDYNALEPYIDEETLHYHHDKHLKTYVDNLNKALKDYPQLHSMNLPTLIVNIESLPSEIQTAVRNNGGGVFNHNLYFSAMRKPREDNQPSGELAEKINKKFGSYEDFKKALTDKALGQFGSGYAWLVTDREGNLDVLSTPNQNTPIGSETMPLLPLDVWEHAYYLKYKNKRAEYAENFFKLINWDYIEELYKNRENFFK